MNRFVSPFIAFAALGMVTAVSAQDAFPVTIEHAFGETVIEAKPERVATIGWMSQDAVIALGVVPAGVPFTAWGGNGEGFYPWTKAALDELGQGNPELINFDDGIPFEDILATDPDVIVARYSGLTQEEYDRLSDIAPTVAYADQPWSGEWRDIVLTVGKVLGKTPEAETLVADTEEKVVAVRAEHPEFAGQTFTFAGNLADGAGELATYVSTDPRVQLLEDFGLTLSDGAKALPTDQGFNVPVSLENLSTVDADILLVWHMDQAGQDYIKSNEQLSRFRPVADDKFISILDRPFVMATSAPSPLSTPYAIDTLVPALADIID